jgi:hypothetical protein
VVFSDAFTTDDEKDVEGGEDWIWLVEQVVLDPIDPLDVSLSAHPHARAAELIAVPKFRDVVELLVGPTDGGALKHLHVPREHLERTPGKREREREREIIRMLVALGLGVGGLRGLDSTCCLQACSGDGGVRA